MLASILTGSNIISLIRFTPNESTNQRVAAVEDAVSFTRSWGKRKWALHLGITSLNLARPLMAHHSRAQANRHWTEKGSCKCVEQMKARPVSPSSTFSANDSMCECEFTSLMKANLISTNLNSSPAVSADADVCVCRRMGEAKWKWLKCRFCWYNLFMPRFAAASVHAIILACHHCYLPNSISTDHDLAP